MELSKQQTAALFAFVEKKGVRYIDVQYELVDHLASAIEDQLRQNKEMSFKEALQKVYGQFPITGFDSFLREKENAMFTYWRRKMGTILLQYFSFPKLLMVLMLSILYGTIACIQGKWAIILCVAICLLGFISSFYTNYLGSYSNTTKYLVLNKYMQVIGKGTLSMAPIAISTFLVNNINEGPLSFQDPWMYFVIGYCVLSTVLVHASIFEFPKILVKEIQNKYAHLKIKLA